MAYLIYLLMSFIGFSFSQPLTPLQPYCSGDFDFDCGVGELRNRCISSFWSCDYIFDCTTGKDEGVNCKYLHQCPSGFFMCRNGDCILASKRCDSKQDCLDRSDERACFELDLKTENEDFESDQKVSAEAFVEIADEENGTAFSIFFFFILLLVICLMVILIYCVNRRFPDTKSRVDQVLKDFGHSVGNIPTRISGRSASSEARVNILVPAESNDNQYFDNPLSTLQPPLTQPPLTLNISDMSNSN